MMLFDKSYEIEEILDKDVDEKELIQFAEDYELNTSMDTTNKWYVYCVRYGLNRDLDIITSKSFADTVTTLVTGLRMNTVPEYYRQDKILDSFIFNYIWEVYEDEPKVSDFPEIFEDILVEYECNADNYSYKTEQILMKLSIPLKTRFMEVKGDTYSEKISNLLNVYDEFGE